MKQELSTLSLLDPVSDLSQVIESLIKNTRTLLERLITQKTPSESASMCLLLLQHLSVLLNALEKADIPQPCIPDLLSLVMPITEYLTSQGYGNAARRYHDWTIRLIRLRSGEFTTLLSDLLAAKGHSGKLNFEDKLDESRRHLPQPLGTTGNMIVSLRDFMESWQIIQKDKVPDEKKGHARATDISQLEMEFLYQISLNLLTGHQCRYAPGSTLETSHIKWASLQTAILSVAQRLKRAKDSSLAWHFLYTLQQSAPCQPEWQQQLLHLLSKASQQILGNSQFDIEQIGDWQRYRATLFQYRQDLAVELADMKKLGKDPQPRFAAAEIYSQKTHALIKTMMEECTQLLGPPPGQLAFCFLTLGSFSRREVLPFSDFEAVCLVGDEKHTAWNNDDSRVENRYLAAWYDYFQFKMISLGETAGLRLDEDSITKGHPGEPELRKTPAQLMAMLRTGSHTADKLYYSLLNAQYLYGVNSDALFVTYQQELKNLFTASKQFNKEEKYEITSATTVMQQIAYRHLQSCDEFFRCGPAMKESPEKFPIHLKQDYWEPLIYLLHHLALYYGKVPGSTREAITFLADNKLIMSTVAQDLQTAVADLYQLRWRQHHQRHSQYEFWEEKTDDTSTIELQRLHSIKNRLLIPGYSVLSHWLSRHEWPADPFAAYWNENLPVWLEAKSLNEARIDRVTDFLCSAQITTPIIYQQAYQKIIDTWQTSSSKTRELTKYFYDRLCAQLKAGGLPLTQYYAIIKAVGDTPLPDGTRWWRIDNELRWRKTLAAHWLIADSPESLRAEIAHYQKNKLPLIWANVLPALLYGDEKKSIEPTTRHLVKAAVAEKLIDSHGKWRATPGLPGRRPVIAYPNKYSPDFYIKPLPELPGIEYAIHALSQRWMGEATANSQLITLTFTDYKKTPLFQHPHAYPVLVSEAITQAKTLAGNHLENALLAENMPTVTNSPSVQARLDPFHFTQWFFLSLLIHPEDGTPHNFVVIQTSTGQYRLIGIDNDHHFVRPFLSGWRSGDSAYKDICTENKSPIPTDPNAQQLLQVKTILFCLDQMQGPLDQQAIEAYLALDLPALIQAWLEDLAQWDQHHQSLLGKDQNYYLEGSCEHFSYIRPVFGSQTITRLYQTSERLRRFLLDREQSSITHLECLRQIHPLIGRRYLPLHEHDFKKRSPIGRFKYLTDELKKIRSFRLPSSLSGRDILERMEGLSGEESLFDQIRNQKAYHPDEALKHLRRCLEEKKPLEQKKAEIQTGQVSPTKLAALFSKEILLPAHRAEILKIVPFARIAKEDHSAIFQSLSGQDYEALDVSEVRGLNRWDWARILLENVNLQRLSIKNCSGIRDSLLVNLVERCMALTDLTLNNVSIIRVEQGGVLGFFPEPLYWPLLRRLDLKGCQRLESISLIAPKLESLYASDCPRLQTVSIKSDALRRLDLTGATALNQLQLTGRASSSQSDCKISIFADEKLRQECWRKWFLLRLAILFGSSAYGLIDEPQSHYWFEEYVKWDKEYNDFVQRVNEKIAEEEEPWVQENESRETAFLKAVINEYRQHLFPDRNYDKVSALACQHRAISTRVAQVYDNNTPFLKAAFYGNVQFMQKLLETYPEEKLWAQQNKSGDTALHLGLKQNHNSVLELACQHRAISIKIGEFKQGNTPFLEAADHGNAQFMQKLLNAFPKEKLWKQKNKNRNTAFHLAVAKNHDAVLELVCQQRAISIETVTGIMGNTPFLEAASQGKIRFMKMLIEAFSDKKIWEQQDINGNTAFHNALRDKENSILELSFEKKAVPIDVKNLDGCTPFLKAAYYGQVDWMRRLLDTFPKQNLWEQKDKYGNTAGHLALLQGHDLIIDFFLTQSDPSLIQRTNHLGYSLLHVAAKFNRIKWFTALVCIYALAVDQIDTIGTTPAMLAACYGHLEALQLLDALEANLSLVDAYGDTAFTIAKYNDRENITQWLTTKGYSAPYSEIKAPSSTAKMHPEVAAWGGQYGSHTSAQQALHIAICNGDLTTATALLRQGSLINAIDTRGNTPLLVAVHHGQQGLLEWLIRRGADLNIQTSDGQRLLQFAVTVNQYQIVWYLIDHIGFNINETYKQQQTVLVQAVRLGHDRLVRKLLRRNPYQCLKIFDYNSEAPLLFTALSAGNAKIVNRLLKAGASFHSLANFSFLPWLNRLRFSHTMIIDCDIAALLTHESIKPHLEYLYLDNSQAAGDTLQALEFSLKTNFSLWQCTYPAVWQKSQYATQFTSVQKAIQRNRYRLWLAQWQLLLGVTASLTKLTPIILLPRTSSQILQQIVSWLDWPLINWRFSQVIDVLKTYKLSTSESTAIDLSAQNPNYITAIKSMLLTQFGLFQKSSNTKSEDDHPHCVSKIICEYL